MGYPYPACLIGILFLGDRLRSQLDRYLHVPGIDLDTGKPKDYGIPYAGEYGRDWFNGWRKRFWAEYYRREVFIPILFG